MNKPSKYKFWIEGTCQGDVIVWKDHIGGEPMYFKQAKRCADVALSIEGPWRIIGYNAEASHQIVLHSDIWFDATSVEIAQEINARKVR